MKKYVLLFALLLGIGSNAQAQVQQMVPADDFLIQQAVANDNDLVSRYQIYEANLKMLQQQAKSDTLINGKRIIPVVFHVIHVYGAENISDAQIYDAVAKLNIDYNKQNADTAETYSMFQSRAANCQIEFRLAQIDPDGNCTSGIVRHYDPETNYAYFGTMAKYAWTPSHYMNIFAVNMIYPEGMSLPEGAFIGGMSPFPPSNTLTQALTGGDTLMDGVLIRQDCIGSIGTAENLAGMPLNMENRTFTHETGHYFNLYHPFQSLYASFGINGCGNFLFTAGDEVDDTPPVAVASQNTSVNCLTPGSLNTCTNDSPDEPDMVENYMDYQFGYCTNIFTVGQLDRINTTLNNDRRALWSFENLLATGVLDTNATACAPIADFFANTLMVCAGSSVSFTDASFNGTVDTWSWSFSGGSPATSNDQNPVISYPTPGVYDVELHVYNAAGDHLATKSSYIYVSDPASSLVAPYTESFETMNFATDILVQNDTNSAWALNTAVGYTGTKSAFLNNFDAGLAGSYDRMITPAFDLSELTAGNHAKITFRYAYAGKYVPAGFLTSADTIYDVLNVLVSTDCGKTWVNKLSYSGEILATAAPVETAYEPASQTEWALGEIVVPSSQLVNYSNARLKFEFYSNGGNNIYIDDIMVFSLSASIDEYVNPTSFVVFPNPADDMTSVSFELATKANVSLSVLDVAGREVFVLENKTLSPGAYSYPLMLSQLKSKGSYMVRLSVNGTSLVRTVVF